MHCGITGHTGVLGKYFINSSKRLKFNKYFGRFRDEIKAFFTAYQGCAGNSKAIDLQLLDISGFVKTSNVTILIKKST